MKQLDEQIQQYKQEIVAESREQGVDLRANLQQIEKMIKGQITQKQVLSDNIVQPVYYSNPIFFKLLHLSLRQKHPSEETRERTLAASCDIDELEKTVN